MSFQPKYTVLLQNQLMSLVQDTAAKDILSPELPMPSGDHKIEPTPSVPSAWEEMRLEEESEIEMATEILVMLFLLMIAISCGHFLKRSGHKFLQEAGLTTLIGLATGFVLKNLSITGTMEKISNHFNSMFMILLLPPIIFESGYNLAKKPFLNNIGSIFTYAFGGTFIAIFFSSGMFYVTGMLGLSYEFTTKDCFAFGSLISATDPVAVLAIFKVMDVDENLNALVFGESIFNDAISIVMYQTVKNLGIYENQSPY